MTEATRQLDRAKLFLVLSAVVTVLLYYVIPHGRTVAYPLMLLSTLAHEMGHGIAAMITGASFEAFHMAPDGSGVAMWRGNPGRFGRAFISMGGLVGPAIVAAIGFALGRDLKRARVLLIAMGGVLVLSLILVVRGGFGMAFVAVVAAILLVIGIKAKPWISQVTVVFLAVQLALAVFSRSDYLFTDVAQTADGGLLPSDTQQMANALFLPYWFWGALVGVISVGVLFFGLRVFFKASGPAKISAAELGLD